ncbi:ABC-type sugar transport system permease subunit [Paenibacillus methanolicus]|uniref:ABC-type sugar transport system permease subunit n=1 Tax=Paenibacillus methanolicus TaxID=582686 RepID=A0A5S5CBB4_9BACL|nr:sugar ABC transporter permease [Paenibacillus methanolicus]TYP76644.1 ABC-type sugar transport system permease subunit [Paenibacillus methanolicus]
MIKRSLTLTRKRALLGILFILPWLLGFLFLYASPFIQSVRFSFSELKVAPSGYGLSFIGLDNYHNALRVDPNFNRILTESVSAMAYNVPMILFFSLFAATLLNSKFRGRALARAVFFLPVILASGAIAEAQSAGLIQLTGSSQIAQELGEQQNGFDPMILANMLGNGGIPVWFIEYIVTAVNRIYEIIRGSGVQILIFLAALQSVPTTMYEVAKMEGATAYESFWKITFPMVSPLILTNVIYTIIDSFADSQVTQYIYETAFTSQNFGLSAAMAWMYTLVVSLILVVVGFFISRRVFYYN